MELDRFLPSVSMPVREMVNETVESRKIFYRLGESEVFQYANKNTTISGTKLIDVIPRMTMDDQGFTHVDYKDLDDTVKYELFDGPKYRIPCKKAMITMLETGQVQMVYGTEYRIPTSIPYIVQTSSNKANIKVFVNITDFVEVNSFGKYVVNHGRNYGALMSVIFAACVAYKIVATNITLPATVADTVVLVYANMLERVINSIMHMDPITRDKVKYLTTKFALIQMYGTEEGERLFYRYQQKYFPKLSKILTDTLDAQFKLDHFDKFSLFVEELKTQYKSMHGLTDYMIYDKWIRSYGAATAMSIDYFGYHLYTICMVLFESPLINRTTIEPVMEKNRGSDLYKQLPLMIM